MFGEWECNGDKTHTRRCLDEYNVKCTYSETANCQIRAATCTEKSVCSDCGAVYGDELEHDFTGIYRLAQSGHQRKCTRCDEWSAVESHTVGTAATCTEATICGVCDLPYGDELGHDFSGAYRLAQGGHQRKCTRCDEWSAVESHTVGTAATCTAKAICGICDLPYGDELGHDFSGAYVAAQDGHRRECARCPELDGVEEHVPGSAATCGSEQICAVCGWVMGDSLIHWYGDWTPADNETHSAKCIRHGCAWEKTVACAKVSVEFDGHDISLCAVCGGVSEGDTLAVLPEASAATQPGNQPRGEMIARVGTLGGETIVSLCFEIGGVLLTPEGEMLVTLPTDALKGDRLFALGADGEWVELTFQIQTIDGKDMLTFTIDFGLDSPSGAPVLILRAA